MSSGKSVYTIGPGGDIDTTRPTEIIGVVVRDTNGNDYQVTQVDDSWFRAIPSKSSTSQRPDVYWYNPVYPLSEIHLYPVPSVTGETMFIDARLPLTDMDTLTTDASFPPEYLAAIKWALAVELAPEYGKPVTRDLSYLASGSMDTLRRANAVNQMRSVRMEFPASSFNIYTGV